MSGGGLSGGGFGLFLSELFGLSSGAFFLLGPLFGLRHRLGFLLGVGFCGCGGFGLCGGFEAGLLCGGGRRPGIFLSFCTDQGSFGFRLLAGVFRRGRRFCKRLGLDCRQFLFGILAGFLDGGFEFLLGLCANGGNFGCCFLACPLDQ